MLGTILGTDPYLGRIITGRIFSGQVHTNQQVKVINSEGKTVDTGRITKILAFRGMERTAIEVGVAGDIVALSGLSKGTVADTFCSLENTIALKAQPIDPPTVQMSFLVNDSPLAGLEARNIRERLDKELIYNVALRVENTQDSSEFLVSGRGELHLSILIETMRREGFELGISKPQVVQKR